MNQQQESPSLVGVGAIFIDDIVLPDGRTHMATLGGGVIHAMMGAAIWDETPGLCGFAGQGLPEEIYAVLKQNMNLNGLITLDIPQVRAWQIFEFDGKRRELHRVDEVKPFVEGTQPQHLAPNYHTASAYYLLQDFDGIRRWHEALNGMLLWEPNQLSMTPENSDQFRDVLQTLKIDVVSPNLLEAQAIYGALNPDNLVDAMLNDRANVVALRMGEAGSIVANTDERYLVPIVPVANIKDQTGAGNTYCGGFLTGLLREKGLYTAGVMGAVSASFCLETIGVAIANAVARDERNRRFAQLNSTKT